MERNNKSNNDKMENKKILAIVVPCYQEEDVLHETSRRLGNFLTKLINEDLISCNSFVMYVNDGSTDKTWPIIDSLHEQHSWIRGINLAGNVGHQNALFAGLATAYPIADWIVSIDADLQDDIDSIKDMVIQAKKGIDIVYGVRKERTTDTWFKRNTALAFYKFMGKMGVKQVYNHADFRLMSKRAVEQLCQYPERNLYLRGMIPLIGYKTETVYYDRAERFAGESKYPISKMMNLAVDGITSFSVKPIRMCFVVGILFCIIAFCIAIWAIICLCLGQTVSGWTSLILSLWFVGGCLMVSIGIVGEYIGKIYIESKRRPRYNIEKII